MKEIIDLARKIAKMSEEEIEMRILILQERDTRNLIGFYDIIEMHFIATRIAKGII